MRHFESNIGCKELFDQKIILDWYDGTVLGFGKSDDYNKWFICSLVYFDPEKLVRVYVISEASDELIGRAKQYFENRGEESYHKLHKEIKSEFENYKGDIYLFKGESLESINYKIIKVDSRYLVFFDDLEDVIDQEIKLAANWIIPFD